MTYEVDTIELRKRMVEKEINTVEALSDASGVNRNTLADILNGKAFPSSMVMSKIGIALDLAGSDLGSIFFKSRLA